MNFQLGPILFQSRRSRLLWHMIGWNFYQKHMLQLKIWRANNCLFGMNQIRMAFFLHAQHHSPTPHLPAGAPSLVSCNLKDSILAHPSPLPFYICSKLSIIMEITNDKVAWGNCHLAFIIVHHVPYATDYTLWLAKSYSKNYSIKFYLILPLRKSQAGIAQLVRACGC